MDDRAGSKRRRFLPVGRGDPDQLDHRPLAESKSVSADSEHGRAVRNWGLLTAGDTFSILGGVFAYSSVAGAEALTIESGLALAGLAGGVLAWAAALPIVI